MTKRPLLLSATFALAAGLVAVPQAATAPRGAGFCALEPGAPHGQAPFLYLRSRLFSLGYPLGWRLTRSATGVAAASRREPELLVRAGLAAVQQTGPSAAALAQREQLEPQPGYRFVGTEPSFALERGQLPAACLETVVGSGAARVRQVDLFVAGDGGAVVWLHLQAPAATYAAQAATLRRIAATFFVPEND